MRQSGTLEVIANHPVLPTISVQEHTGNRSQISWFWHATDFSNGELKEEVFCARFVYMEGSSNGIGVETARVLAMREVQIVMAVRNTDAGTAVKGTILKETPSAKIEVLKMDVSSMASVRKFVKEFKSSVLPLNILINTAGVMALPYKLSADKIELQFATNHLGHFLLTNLLLETMKNTASQSTIETL